MRATPAGARPGVARPTRALVALASWGLPGAPRLTGPVGPDEGVALVAWAEATQLLGPLALAVQAGDLVLLPDARALLAERQEASLWWSLAVEHRLLHVRSIFAAAGGIDHLVIKGPAVAHLDEGDPSLRSFADLDLLVRAHDLDRAVAALEASGATRPWAERRPGFDHRFAKSVTLTGPDAIELDLHRSLCDGAHGFRIPLDRLFAERGQTRIGDQEVDTLGLVQRVLHAAYHAILGSPTPKLMSLRDLAGYLTRADVSMEAVLAEARRWRGEAVLATAVGETLDALSFDAPAWLAWQRSRVVDPREQAVIERHRREGSTPGRAKLDGLRELTRLDAGRYLFALAVPSSAHLQSRGLTLGSVYRRRLTRTR